MATHAIRATGLAMLALTLGTAGCNKSDDRPPPARNVMVPETATRPAVDEPLVAEPGTTVVTLAVEGMHCSGCVEAITEKVETLDGVRKVRVSLANRTAWVMLDDARRPQTATVIAAIESLGYKAKSVDAPATRPSPKPETRPTGA